MIGFYRRGTRTLTAILANVWAWRHRHPWWSTLIALVASCAGFVIFSTTYAWAADGDASPLTPFLPGGTLHDSAGVAVINYTRLPLDRGFFDAGKGIPTMLVDGIWTFHLAFVAWTLWFLEWLLNFEWVSWLSAPFNSLADTVQGLLGDLNWIPFALAITGLVAGAALLLGKVGSSLLEMLLAVVAVVLATGILANPVQSLTAAGGALDKAQEYSAEVSAAVVTDRGEEPPVSGDVLSEAVTTQLVDIFVRQAAQTIAFGHVLPEQCAAVFNNAMTTSAPILGGGETVREQVSACDPLAKVYVENPGFPMVWVACVVASGSAILKLFALAAACLLIYTVVCMLLAALKSMWYAYLAMLPVNRYPLWRSLGDVLMGIVSIFVIVVAIAAYLKLVVDVIQAAWMLSIVAFMMLVNIFMIILIVLLFRIRRAARKAGRSMAEQMSHLGLRSGGQRQPNRALTAAVMSSVATTGLNLLTRPKPGTTVDARSINVFGPPQTKATPLDDLGEMTVQGRPSRPTTPTQPGGGPKALEQGKKALPAGKTADTASKAAGLGLKIAKIAKAAPGGPAALAGAAALEVGKDVVQSQAAKAVAAKAAPTQGNSRPAGQSPASPRPAGRRIVVGVDGTGHIQRTKIEPVYTITNLQPAHPEPQRPQRSVDLRALIAARKQLNG